MTLEVGDKAVVFNAGTDYARAVKWETPEVGDKVTVVTLSDGTKIPLPRIDLSTSDYVFVIPTWDLPFSIGGGISWEMLPLGASVFTITGKYCEYIEDIYREWEEASLVDCYFINLSLLSRIRDKSKYPTIYSDEDLLAINTWVITGNTNNAYYLRRLNELLPPGDLSFNGGMSIWSKITEYLKPNVNGTLNINALGDYYGIKQTCDISSAYFMSFKYRTLNAFSLGSHTPYFHFIFTGIGAQHKLFYALGPVGSPYAVIASANDKYAGYTNPSYPDFDTINVNLYTDTLSTVGTHPWEPATYYYQCLLEIVLNSGTYSEGRLYTQLEIDDLVFYDINHVPISRPCIGGMQVGDQYIIYNPTTKKLVLNDSSKTILAAANWRDVVTPGEVINTLPVEYVWDGQGKVYLSQSKTTLSTIFFDDQLMVVGAQGTTSRTLGYADHDPDEITYSGVTVKRELVDITRCLRAGKNSVMLYIKDTTGTKIGFPTPVYIMRSL